MYGYPLPPPSTMTCHLGAQMCPCMQTPRDSDTTNCYLIIKRDIKLLSISNLRGGMCGQVPMNT